MKVDEVSMKSYDLVVVGEISPDLILTGDELTPRFGEMQQLIDNATLSLGSSAVITACGAVKLGLRVAFVGIVGNDLFGQFMLNAMRTRGIDCTHCLVDAKLKTGFNVVMAQRNGDRAVMTFAGAMSALQMGAFEIGLLAHTRHLHVGSYFLLDALRDDLPTLFELAQSRGVTTSLDPNWDPSDRWNVSAILPYCDLLLANQAEIARLSGTAELQAGLAALTRIVEIVAVKLGRQGAIARRGAESHASPALAINAVDTTGAGDSFNAAFIYAFLQRYPLAKAIQFACVCASLSTTAIGGTAAQPTLAEAEAAYKKAEMHP